MNIKSLKVAALALALGAAGAVAQSAAADEGRFYIVPGVQWMDFDSDRQADDNQGYMIGLGYGLSDNLALELNHTKINLHTVGGRDRLRNLRLDLVYKLDNSVGTLSPYFVGGIGGNKFDVTDSQTMLNFGAGLSYRFNDRLEWRTAARTFYGLRGSTYDFGIDTGLVVHLGSAPQRRVEPTPAPAPVAAVRDSDGDGVPDDRDECPNTPPNYAVDERGCPIIIEEVARITLAVQFDFDRAEVRPEFFDDIRRVADFLNEHQGIAAALEGHTCNMGAEDYNQGLSERRAAAVRQLLVDRFGVSASRITSTGYGESRPAASNATQEGRERNRRVESSLSTTVQRPQLRN